MGFLASSCSFTRFRVIDPVPDGLWAEIPQLLKNGAFLDIDETAEDQSDGWVSFDDYLDTTWQAGPPQIGAYIAFSLRVDTRRIPAGVVRKHLVLALKREKAENEKNGKKFISRERRKELKELVQLSLRRRFLPVPGEFNVIWNTANNEIWFASTQTKILELFAQRFLDTFRLHIEQLTPPYLALSMLGEVAGEAIHDADSVDYTMDGILGQDFLTWLWWRAATANPYSAFPVSINTRIVVTGGDGAEKETVMVTSNVVSPLKEAKIGLARGKKVSRVTVYLIADDFAYEATIDAQTFALSGVRPPEIENEEEANPDDLLLEKIFLIQKVVSQLDAHYRDFLTVRMDGEEWGKTAEAMSKWIMEG